MNLGTKRETPKGSGGQSPFPFWSRLAVPVWAALAERQLQAHAPMVENLARTFRANIYQSNSGTPSTQSPTEEKWIILISACLITR